MSDEGGSALDSLRKRKLVQWAAGYAAVAWVALQVLSLVGQQFEWSPGLLRVITIALGLGFFVTVVLAWFHGERGEQKVTLGEAALLSVLMLIGAGLMWRTLSRVPDAAAPTGAPAASATPAAAAPIPKKSIAVLPFTDLSPGKDQEYFSDGMAEEILNALAKVKDLKVAGRTSSFSFKGKNEDLRSIGKALAVANVLEGSVRKQGDKVRITAQLIQAEDGYHLWSETYDGDLKDVFELQERIARAITDQLKIVLEGAQQQRLVKVATENQEAYALYLQATGIFNRRDGPRMKDAISQLESAIGLDPMFARAHSRLAAVLAIARIYSDTPDNLARIEEHAQRARDLDPSLGEPYAALAQAQARQRHWLQALAGFERALALEPDDVTANFWYGIALVQVGYVKRGNAQLDRVLALDPMLPNALFWRGTQALRDGDFANGKRLLQRAQDAGLSYAGSGLAEVAAREGHRDEAVRLMAIGLKGLQNTLSNEDAAILANGIYGDAAARTAALAWIDAALAKPRPYPFVVLRTLMLMGESPRSLALSAEGATVNEASYLPLFWGDYGRAARTSPAFTDYARKTGLAEVWDQYGEPDLCHKRAPLEYVCD